MTKKLKEYKIIFQKQKNDEQNVSQDDDKLGLRSKLGGKPDWDQFDDTPKCPECKKEMTFISQIDSIEHESDNNPHSISALSDNQEYMFGDVGIIYTFFCFDCCEVKSVFQCG